MTREVLYKKSHESKLEVRSNDSDKVADYSKALNVGTEMLPGLVWKTTASPRFL